jgi:hypothetical protein
MTKMPRVWEILKEFKDCCKEHNWRTSENEDWIEVGNHYHNFLYAREVHPSSLRRIAANKKCVVREGLAYRVVEAAYTAWLLSETPSYDLLKTVYEDPELPRRIAVYDLSPLLSGKKQCGRLNETDSAVFQEFEDFLKSELGIKMKPLPVIAPPEAKTDSYTVAELA